jgi:hypothetical protein
VTSFDLRRDRRSVAAKFAEEFRQKIFAANLRLMQEPSLFALASSSDPNVTKQERRVANNHSIPHKSRDHASVAATRILQQLASRLIAVRDAKDVAALHPDLAALIHDELATAQSQTMSDLRV